MSCKQILIVDDDSQIRFLLSRFVMHWGYRPLTATNGHEALKVLETFPVDLVLTDFHMPIMDGREFLQKLCRRNSCPPAFIMSCDDLIAQTSWVKESAMEFFCKPINFSKLQTSVHDLLEKTSNKRINSTLQNQL